MKRLWRKSSHSGTHNCVEVARADNVVAVRDSKTEFGSAKDAHLAFTPSQFGAFLALLRKGDVSA